MFKRKKKLRHEINEDLLETLLKCKDDWLRKKSVIERSIEPSGAVLHQLKLAKAKYFFLLKEARYQNITFKQK